MKRVGIALALLALVVLLSSGALFLQRRATDHLIEACDEMITIYRSGDTERCRKKAEEFSQDLEQDMRWFPFFLAHERMESIFQQAGALPYLVNDDDPADFFAALATIRVQLGTLMDNEWPTPSNIL